MLYFLRWSAVVTVFSEIWNPIRVFFYSLLKTQNDTETKKILRIDWNCIIYFITYHIACDEIICHRHEKNYIVVLSHYQIE